MSEQGHYSAKLSPTMWVQALGTQDYKVAQEGQRLSFMTSFPMPRTAWHAVDACEHLLHE